MSPTRKRLAPVLFVCGLCAMLAACAAEPNKGAGGSSVPTPATALAPEPGPERAAPASVPTPGADIVPAQADRARMLRKGGCAGNRKSVDGNRVLVVNENKKNGNTDDPEATWITLTDDGTIVCAGNKPERLAFDTLKVGQRVEAWSTGLRLLSYPSQCSVVKIAVLD
ncbi:DUF3221 domain-containing protein [Paenibacillus sp. GYB003]|uniref:DUF3221 domain-containing protein n=1 Tax=Paenibacillus sp. GYB003 TaxID=2994392 RepID=UPI002F96CB50